jgi:hypothetical protein
MSEIRVCVDCGDKYPFDYKAKKGSTTRCCSACARRQANEITKRAMLDAAGGGCKNCGYKKCLAAITFFDPISRLVPVPDPKNRDEKIKWASQRIPLCLNCAAEFEQRMIHLNMQNAEATPPICSFYTDVASIVHVPSYSLGMVDENAPKLVTVEITNEEPNISREAKSPQRTKENTRG